MNMNGILSDNVTTLLDFALPYSDADKRCGMKKRAKTMARLKLAALLNIAKKGRHVNLRQVTIMVDFPTFEQKVIEWIAGLKKS